MKTGVKIVVRCHWCGEPCEIMETSMGNHYVWCDACSASGPVALTVFSAVNDWLRVLGEHSALPLSDGMRVRLVAAQGGTAGDVPVGTLGTVRVEEGRNGVRSATVEWDGIEPRGGLGGDAFGLRSAKWWPRFLELADPAVDPAARPRRDA